MRGRPGAGGGRMGTATLGDRRWRAGKLSGCRDGRAVVGGLGGIGSSIRDVGVGAPKTQIITVSFSTEDSY